MLTDSDLFADYEAATLWYHPMADRLFIFHKATFLMLPCLEREDGKKMIVRHPYDVNAEWLDCKLEYIGVL